MHNPGGLSKHRPAPVTADSREGPSLTVKVSSRRCTFYPPAFTAAQGTRLSREAEARSTLQHPISYLPSSFALFKPFISIRKREILNLCSCQSFSSFISSQLHSVLNVAQKHKQGLQRVNWNDMALHLAKKTSSAAPQYDRQRYEAVTEGGIRHIIINNRILPD